MGVILREKKLKGGRVSFYLDITHNGNRWTEFLDIHAKKIKPTDEDKNKKQLAIEIRAKRESELIVQENGLIDKSKRKADFVVWLENHWNERGFDSNRNINGIIHLKRYQNGRSLPFNAVTPEWILKYQNHLLSKVSNNCAFCYISDIRTALKRAVKADIIPKNPFDKIEKEDRLKKQDVFRNAFTFDELQILADAPYKMEPQFKQAYFFSCFTGLRWGDVNPLRWTEIITKRISGQEEWFLYFAQGKTTDIEYIPLSDQAIQILKERKTFQMENKEISPYVFPAVKEIDPIKETRYRQVYYRLKMWADAAGFDPKRIHFHTGRHTFATNVLETSEDGDLWTVSKLLGHSSIIPTQIYAHVRDNRKKSAVKALPILKLNTGSAA